MLPQVALDDAFLIHLCVENLWRKLVNPTLVVYVGM